MSSFLVNLPEENSVADFGTMGGGHVSFLPQAGSQNPTVGDYVTAPLHGLIAPYQIYQMTAIVNYNSLTSNARLYLPTGGINALQYDESISIISAYATSITAYNGSSPVVRLSCDFPYSGDTTVFDLLVFNSAFVTAGSNGKGQIDGTTIAQGAEGGAGTATTFPLLKSQPRLFFRQTAGTSSAGSFTVVINFAITSGYRYSV